MMRFVFLSILILISLYSNSALPSHLKCVDNLCNDNVSTARTMEFITSISGELKELKRYSKVNIKGKNVDSNDVFWLVEFDGSKGFFNSSMLKENNNSVKTSNLQIVVNPFYVAQPSVTSDETEDREEPRHIKPISKRTTMVNGKNDETEDSDFVTHESSVNKKSIEDKLQRNENFKDPKPMHKSNINVQIDVDDDKKDSKILNENSVIVKKEDEIKQKHSEDFNTDLKDTDKENESPKNIQIIIKTDKSLEKKDFPKDESNKIENSTINQMTETNHTDSNHTAMKDENISNNESHTKTLQKSIFINEKVSSTNNDGAHSLPIESHDIVVDNENIISNDSDVFTNEQIRSPLLMLMFKVEGAIYPLVKSFIKSTGLSSSSYLTSFVNNWLSMSLESFVLVIFLMLSLVIMVYSPRILRLSHDWKYEYEKQRQLFKDLELKLLSMTDVHDKLSIQTRNFEKVIEGYIDQLNDVREEAVRNERKLMVEFDHVKKNNEKQMQELSRDLGVTAQQCEMFERDVIEKIAIIEGLHLLRIETEDRFSRERIEWKEAEEVLQKRLLEVEELKKALLKESEEKCDLERQIDILSTTLSDTNEKMERLRSCFEHFQMFEGLNEEERRVKVAECLESREVRDRVKVVEREIEGLRVQMREADVKRTEAEQRCLAAERTATECEEQRCQADKARQTAEATLQVMTEYFQTKQTEMQRRCGTKSEDQSQAVDRTETLEKEKETLTRTVQDLQTELRDLQAAARKSKMDLSNKIADDFLTISGLERDLMTEREEARKLRCRLSNYVGPVTAPGPSRGPPSGGQTRPPSQGPVPTPPIYPLPVHTTQNGGHPRPGPLSGRTSATSLSKRSNNS